MAFNLVRVALVACGAWIIWTVIRRITAKTSLDNVPGPHPKKLSLTGELLMI